MLAPIRVVWLLAINSMLPSSISLLLQLD